MGREDVWEGVTRLETDLVRCFRTDMLRRELGLVVEVMVDVVVDVVGAEEVEDAEGVVAGVVEGVVGGVVVEGNFPLWV